MEIPCFLKSYGTAGRPFDLRAGSRPLELAMQNPHSTAHILERADGDRPVPGLAQFALVLVMG